MINFKTSAAVLALSSFALLGSACATSEGASTADMRAESAMMKAETKEATTDTMDEMDMMPEAPKDTMMMEEKPEAIMVGGAAMYPTKTIVENASTASNLTTLVSLVQMADLVETLSSDGPFTVFAPTNTAFSFLPSEVTTSLTDPANKEQLVKVLTAHVVSGNISAADLENQLMGRSSYTAQTVSGDTLTFYKMGDEIRVADENGTLAKIETADVVQSNGVVHVVSSVLVPK